LPKEKKEISRNLVRELQTAALEWMRYDKQYPLVALERGTVSGTPDVFGVHKNRFTTEIEIKISVSDFRANRKKEHVIRRESGVYRNSYIPNYFYYLVPPELVDKIRPEVEAQNGLMTLGTGKSYSGVRPLVVLKPALRNHTRRQTIKQCVQMAQAVSGTLVSLCAALHKKDLTP